MTTSQGGFSEVNRSFGPLGWTAFGGPAAHLGYFRTEFVERRRWLTDATYADLVAMSQFLPGPASSKVGMAMGYHRAGLPGMALSWFLFTIPSALILAVFGLVVGGETTASPVGAGWFVRCGFWVPVFRRPGTAGFRVVGTGAGGGGGGRGGGGLGG
ncbi:chromate transporter, partial [Corynebacterium striatum]